VSAGDQGSSADDAAWVPRSEQAATALLGLAMNGAGAKQPGRVALYLHADLSDIGPIDLDGIDEFIRGGGSAHTEAGIDITTDSLWGLLADADIVPVFNWNGTPLCYGRTRRLAPAVLRRVVAHRDRRCRIPGCTAPPNRCDIHHVIEWDNNGDTDPPNSMNACRAHHHGIHDRGWSVTGDANEHLTVRRPDGLIFDGRPAYLDLIHTQRQTERDAITARFDDLKPFTRPA